jgi:hypothetical protein
VPIAKLIYTLSLCCRQPERTRRKMSKSVSQFDPQQV